MPPFSCAPPPSQDVTEIMRQTVEAQQGGSGFGGPGAAMLDFTAGGGGGRPGSQPAERRRLLDALARCCQVGAAGPAAAGVAACLSRAPCALRPCQAGQGAQQRP